MNYELSTVLIAYLLDLAIGDPQWSWHPVRLIGYFIKRLEIVLNAGRINKRFAGIILVVSVVSLTIFCVWGILSLAKFIHPIIYYIVSILFIYFAISIKALGVEANKVCKALTNEDIENARKELSMIVARDTDKLDRSEIMRASVETIAESIMDGIVAPLSYIFLGGPIFAWAYKAINTLDSMVGYRSERYIEFGRISAKVDGLVNFIPARITCFLISISSLCYRKDWVRSFKWGCKYFLKWPASNSEATEAAMAGALKIQLGGLNFYNSIPVPKPFIGDNLYPLEIKHIQESIKISYLCSALMVLWGILLMLIIGKEGGIV